MNSTKDKVFDNTAIIVSDGCCVQLGNTQALDDVTFSITKGKKVAVVGPNGGGKSTLFNALAGLVPVVNGSLKINGLSPQDAKGSISYVPQRDLINRNFPLSVKQVVEMGLVSKYSLNLFSRKQINLKIKEALENVGLSEKINQNINNLSGGQFQRVLIARGLAQDADILLLDEAFSAVDVGAQEDIMSLISDINLDGKTILVATHDINNLEEKFDEVLCLNRHCCAYGNPSEVLTKDVIKEMYGSHYEMFKSHTPESHEKNND
jgi:ABC-type Mn2+/Zn2+ transport system ATPase subunit|tara:strand:- start:214 stop:1005 length:792 start_codon:yes stop_codon:yes gene_type:complete